MSCSKTIKIYKLILDPDVQMREKTDKQIVQQYIDDMRYNREFPPIVVFDDGEKKRVADGFHRVYAARSLKREEIAAEIRRGSKRDAILFAVGANSSHGLPRTNADKRKAAATLLRDPEWRHWSDAEIARKCAVSDRFVSKMRKKLVSTPNGSETKSKSAIRKCADGRIRNIARIGETEERRAARAASLKNKPSPEETPACINESKTDINLPGAPAGDINNPPEFPSPATLRCDARANAGGGVPHACPTQSPPPPGPDGALDLNARPTLRGGRDYPSFLMQIFDDAALVKSPKAAEKTVADYVIGPRDIRRLVMGDDILNVLSSGGALVIQPDV